MLFDLAQCGRAFALDTFSDGVEHQFGAQVLDQFRGGNALRWLSFTNESDQIDITSKSRTRLVGFYGKQALPPWLDA